jgi:phage terminase large subunit-like protein
MNWTTACPDWSERIVRGASLIPFAPIFPIEADEALKVFKSLTIADAVGSPTIGDACLPWVDSGKLAKVGADPAGIGTLVDELAKIGVSTHENGSGILVGVRQGVALMGAIKVMERKLIDGSFKHRLSRMMTWCAGNAVTQQTGTGMRIARDASGYGKIDPLVAGFMCVAEMMLNPKPENGPSIYETRPLLMV